MASVHARVLDTINHLTYSETYATAGVTKQ
jgi:hypothetical protein